MTAPRLRRLTVHRRARPALDGRGAGSGGIGGVLDASTRCADLLLGGRCVGCARPGPAALRRCAAAAAGRRPARVADARCPPGWSTPWAAAAYDGTVRAMVLGHKERRLLALRDPLALLLAAAVAAALAPGTRARCVLVPVPSRPASVRARGHDPTYALTPGAAALLRAAGRDVARRGGCCAPGPAWSTRPGSTPAPGPPTWPARCAARRPALRRLGAAPAAGLAWSSATTSSPPGPRPRRPSARSRPSGCRSPARRGRGGDPQAASRRAVSRVTANLQVPQAFALSRTPTSVGAWSPSGSVVASSRRPGRRGVTTASRCQSQAKRST